MQKQVTGFPGRQQCQLIRTLIGLITVLVGLADMLSAIVPKLNWDILLGAWPIIKPKFPAQTLIVVVGFFLIMLSYGLARGKRHAWLITLALLLLSMFLHIKRGGSVLASLVALLLTLVLAGLYHFFQAKSDPPSARRGYIILTLALGIVMFYTIGGFIALYDSFGPLIQRFGIEGALLHLLTSPPLKFLTHANPAYFFGRALPVLACSSVLYGMFQIFRPVAAVLLPDRQKRGLASEIVQLYGKNSISYFALEEKSYFFSESGRSVIGYVLQGSTAVVAGDPIGPDSELPLVIQQFLNYCSRQDWSIVFWQVRAEIADLYRKEGLHLIKIGEDAIINARTFTLKGGAMANVRSSAKRAEKDGVQVVFYHGQVTNSEQLAQMEHISRKWLANKGSSEKGFSMGRFDPQGDPETLYAVAVDTANRVHAFVSFIPIYGRHGWGLDLMRRSGRTAPGTIELLLARSIEYIKTIGGEMVSLGVAPLSNANQEDATFIDSSIDYLTGHFGNPAQNQSLFNFKKKFQPTWESRYLVYSETLSLPKIGWALYHAHQSDASLLHTIRKTISHKQQEPESILATGPLEPYRKATSAL